MEYFFLCVMQHLFGIIASVLHLGNIKFEADVRGYASLNNNQEMHWVSKVSNEPTADSCHLSPCLIEMVFFFLFCLYCAVAGDSYSGATTGLNPPED